MTPAIASPDQPTTLIVGIDEAGYGPLLGPLVVSAVAFEVPVPLVERVASPAHGPDLWDELVTSITRRPTLRDPRIAVADSKKLHGKGRRAGPAGAKGGVTRLERAALTFLAQAHAPPSTLPALLRLLCPHVLEWVPQYPWYEGADLDLPVDCRPDDLATQSNALRADLAAHGIRFRGAWSEVLPEGHYNRLVSATHNKAVVLFGKTTRLMQRVADAVGPRPLRIWVDRQGGRISYRRPLMTAFSEAGLDVIEESPERSGYRLNLPSAPWLVRFAKNGETHHLPVALASIFSKYLRELFMLLFNRYWAGQVADLRPTAGYYQDGQRFLADIDAAVARQRVERDWLVRTV